jgi:hypothetical protein
MKPPTNRDCYYRKAQTTTPNSKPTTSFFVVNRTRSGAAISRHVTGRHVSYLGVLIIDLQLAVFSLEFG